MSIVDDFLRWLGMRGGAPTPALDVVTAGVSRGGVPTPALHVITAWVPLALTVDTKTTSSAPFRFQVPAGSRDIAAFRSFTRHVSVDAFAALQTANLLRPDPADAAKFQVNVTLRIQYPAPDGRPDVLAGTGALPVVLLNHGHHASWVFPPGGGVTTNSSVNGYAYLQDALAQNGIVSVSIDHNFANFTNSLIETRADTIIAALDALSTEAAPAASRYHGRLDFAKIGLMGHSRGGDAVVRAVKKIRADPALSAKYTVVTACSLAPTDFTGADIPANRTFLDDSDVSLYLVVYGALDGDVAGNGANAFSGTGFRHYDRAQPQKAMVFLDNCCHNTFNSSWFAEGNDSSDPRLASEADHQSVAVDYIGDLFRWQLKGENLAARFDGRTPNRAAQPASLQWMSGQRLKRVDDLENPAANLLGGARAVTAPGSSPTTIDDFASIVITSLGNPPIPLEVHTAHQGHVLHVDLTSATPAVTRVLTTDIPGADRDWSAFDTLIFSLSGWFDPTSAATIAAANLPRLAVTVLDSAGASATAGFNVYGAGLPSRPVFKTYIPRTGPPVNITLMRLETIPIALTVFTGVDLTNVVRIALDIVPDNDTHVFADNIHVVKQQ